MGTHAPHPTRRFSIPPTHELRFELESPTDALSLKLVGGHAEVFGCELVPGLEYGFSHEQRAAVWAPGLNGEGAEVEMSALDSVYVASESALSTYFNLHLALTRLRLLARPSSFALTRDLSQPDDEVAPPRVLIVGERGVGKTTLLKMLVNWRNRAERAVCGAAKPASGVTIVNLDPSEGMWTMPGSIGVASTSAVLPTTTPAAPFGTSFSSGPPVPFPPPTASSSSSAAAADQPPPYVPPVNSDAFAPLVDPLVFFAGHLSANVNLPHYELLLQSVADAAKKKVDEAGMGSWKAGWMVDTPGEWAEKKGGGWERIKAAVRAFEINTLLVVGSERSYVEMTKLMNTNKTVTVVRVPKSDGASDLDLSTQARLQALQTRSYFYGGPPLTQGLLSPFSIIVKLSDLRIVRVGEPAGAHAPTSALPLGATRLTRDTELVEVDLEGPRAANEVVNRILAVPMAEEERDGQEKVVKGPVMGFVWVSALDKEKKKITLLSPLPGRLPRKTLVLGGLDWVDA
ncbi:cleavage polyadenylation factor subunit CLP1 [Rhodotorula paludigena]|uniref:cleavage polyadenylation factor subunit CLP1 n=1 Tax=Rhodotorula paludigena TaxID=86838 RepID=UPI00317C4774